MKKGITVIHDPTGVYSYGAMFSKEDFRCSLEGGVWPTGMVVRIEDSAVSLLVNGTKLVKTKKGNGKEWNNHEGNKSR